MAGIREFFAGKTVFLTGVTGLVGKLVLEKLLRSCTDVERIYVLIRGKKGKSAEDRFKEICDSVAFEKLRPLYPNYHEKIGIIEGDLAEKEAFAIDEATLQTIEVVIHCAATVRFNEPIKRATFINVRGTKQILDMARRMKKLKSFVHVSTAFSFCPHEEIDEIVYDVPMDANSLIAKMEEVTDEVWLKEFENWIVPEWPNTYTLTKAIAETLLLEYSDLPIAIVRPSILVGCAKEPVIGYIDNLFGPIGLMIGIGLGIVRVVAGIGTVVSDLQPVDYAVNLIIAAAWNVANLKNGETARNHNKIFNCVSGPEAQLTWKDVKDYGLPVGRTLSPSLRAIWYPICFFVKFGIAYQVLSFLLHTIPSYIFDALAVISGRKERLSLIYKKADEAIKSLVYFTHNQWTFKNQNTKGLWKQMDEEEKEVFTFDMKGFDWREAMVNCSHAVRVYLMDDPKETIEAGRKKMFKLKIVHYSLTAFLVLLLIWFASWLYSFLF